MKYKIKLSIIAVCALLSSNLYAYKYLGTTKQNKSAAEQTVTLAEACQPATTSTELTVNNVRCRINTGGDMWWDLQGIAQYYIPSTTKKTSMFSGSLWMAGVDVNGQLKCAAQRYRGNGNDFWPGPLTDDGTASVDVETCEKFDKFFKISKGEVGQFIAAKEDPSSFPGYTTPKSILEWPAHGDAEKGQAQYLAPFKDVNGDGQYNPEDGDYPYYDFDGKTCGTDSADNVLFGDQTIWWVFNDKGNIHSETGGSPVGFEIRAQAFGFATNDEINNMTFYNFQIYNRSTYTLQDTYFSLWTDTDLGNGFDDYVGCDVMRGLGYCYNGDAVDGDGKDNEYGANPPAIGVDFFQGPYMDPNGKDDSFDPLNLPDITDPAWNGINGVNFGDGKLDNERFGMRRFVYHDNIGGSKPWFMTDPEKASDYYNLLRGIWKDGQKMMYGGNGHPSSGAFGPECEFMFPGESDVYNWGTGGKLPNGPKNWTEVSAGNTPYDRRFMHSAGPFTLEPGAVNYITVGIPWARATSGGNVASVEALKLADDKCQRLFDNCFRVVNGPDAPDMNVQELDKEIILTLSNSTLSNNYKELYPYKVDGSVREFDFNIITPDSLSDKGIHYDSLYRFQGYMIYQLKDETVSTSEIDNNEKARLVAQCDIQDGVSRLINFEFDENLGYSVPVEKVNGANQGIVHSFRITEDMFATGNRTLINHKKYYYVAFAYAYNNFKTFNPNNGSDLDGQKLPFKMGRMGANNSSIKVQVAIPHIPSVEANGTVLNSSYGYGPKITRLEGNGNGGLVLDLTDASINNILNNSSIQHEIQYENNAGPVDIKVIDPLNVPADEYILKFDTVGTDAKLAKAVWSITNSAGDVVATSDKSISVSNEQVIPSLGLSVTIKQVFEPGRLDSINNGTYGFLESNVILANPNNLWLFGIADNDGPNDFNWIRSGTLEDPDASINNDYTSTISGVTGFTDPFENYEKIAGGMWAPACLAARTPNGPGWDGRSVTSPTANDAFARKNLISNIGSVNIVYTADKSKWTKCVVLEMCNDKILSKGNQLKFHVRKSTSKDMYGNDTVGYGMSWFPGYAVCVETGERLNIAFGEDSWLTADNGADMIFNPTSRIYSNTASTIFGGKHYVYVFGHKGNTVNDMPAYDKGQYLFDKLTTEFGVANLSKKVWEHCWYVGIPLAFPGNESKWLTSDVTVKIRVKRPYMIGSDIAGTSKPVETNMETNGNLPMYKFSTSDIATVKAVTEAAKTALDLVNIVPNPYYAYSAYEKNQLDNRVKIVNLPEKCEVKIYSINGNLIRQFEKDEVLTSIDWDLKNYAGIPVASGIYLIHVKAEGIGERVIKWYGTMRPTDMNSF